MFHVNHFSYFISVIPYLVHAFFHFPPYMEKTKNSINVSRETLMKPTTSYGYQLVSKFQINFSMEVLQADYKEEKTDAKYFSTKKTEFVIY